MLGKVDDQMHEKMKRLKEDRSLGLTKNNLFERFRKGMMKSWGFGTSAADPKGRGRRDKLTI